MNCPLCQNAVSRWDRFSQPQEGTCDICGQYRIDFRLIVDRDMVDPYNDALRAALSAATKQANEGGKALTLTLENYLSYAEAHRWTSVPQKLRKVLEVSRKRSRYFGADFSLKPYSDYPLFDAISVEEAEALIAHLREERLVVGITGTGYYRLTGKGWEAIEPIQSGGILGRCFVAMAFDSDLDDAYYQAIKPAIMDCGYEPICLKEVVRQTNNNITDHILAEIRKAQFIVADFSMQKGGVYFEAGFAKALGKEVFWTCRAEDFKELHFDTNHYGHIKWTDPQDLRRKLADRILAELGKGPH